MSFGSCFFAPRQLAFQSRPKGSLTWSKLNWRGYAGFGPCFHLPRCHLVPVFWSHSHIVAQLLLWFWLWRTDVEDWFISLCCGNRAQRKTTINFRSAESLARGNLHNQNCWSGRHSEYGCRKRWALVKSMCYLRMFGLARTIVADFGNRTASRHGYVYFYRPLI